MGKRKSSLARCTSDVKRKKLNRAIETPVNHDLRLKSMKNNAKRLRLNEADPKRESRILFLRNRAFIRGQCVDLNLAAFRYDSQIDYRLVKKVWICTQI